MTDAQMAEWGAAVEQHLIGALDGVSRGDEISFRCPFHADTNPSASWNKSKRCFSCQACEAKGGCKALAEKLGIAMPNGHARANGKPQGRIVATYDYTTAEGALRFQTVRSEPKDFRQRRPDGNGGFVYNLNGVERVLYRLPDLATASPQMAVFIVEGEKDVDRLRAEGLLATCNPMGAGKWRNEYSATLRGRDVVILPDNDEAGRKHAQAVAESLLGVAASVRVVELPGLEHKGDVSDWLNAGNTIEALMALAEAANRYAGEEEPPPLRYRFVTIAEAMRHRPGPSLVESLFNERGTSFIAGPPGGAKSLIALDIALCRGFGLPFLGRHKVSEGSTAYVVAEGFGGFWQRACAWLQRKDLEDNGRVQLLNASPQLLDGDDIDHLVAAILAMEEPASHVIIDTLGRVSDGLDLDKTKDMGVAVSVLERIEKATRAHVTIVHHVGWDGSRERNNNALRCSVDHGYLTKLVESTGTQGVTFESVKQKDLAKYGPVTLDIVPVYLIGDDGEPMLSADGRQLVSVVIEPEETSTGFGAALSDNEAAVLEAIHTLGRATMTGIEKATSIPKTTVYRAITKLLKQGVIERDQVGKFVAAEAVK